MRTPIAATATVWRDNTLAGRLTRTRDGGVFEYDAAFLAEPHPRSDHGIAYRLGYESPRVETHGTNVHPFFAGLLPEGLRLRALYRRVKTSEDDLLSLLVAAGADCVGDVSVARGEQLEAATPTIDPTKVSSISFREVLSESLAGKRGIEPTLPGVQEKISAGMISLPLRAGKGRKAYILKLNPPHAPRLVENEHFFLKMAEAAGLDAARAELVRDRDDEPGLLVERFDRVVEGRTLKKIHQEDACQFLDRYPADKYAISVADIARGIAELASAPIPENAKLLRHFAFAYVIANGDLHAKNVSLQTTLDGRIEMTPAYDVLSTLPYGDRTMALKLDGRADNLKRSAFVGFGERFGVRARATDMILDEICDAVTAWIGRLDEIGLTERKTADLTRVMKKRRDDLAPSRAKRSR